MQKIDTLAHRIVRHFSGDLSPSGGNVPGHGNSPRDRSVSISQHPRDPNDVLVHCHNGADSLAFKAHLRSIGLLPSRPGRLRDSTVVDVRRTEDRTAKVRARIESARTIWEASR